MLAIAAAIAGPAHGLPARRTLIAAKMKLVSECVSLVVIEAFEMDFFHFGTN